MQASRQAPIASDVSESSMHAIPYAPTHAQLPISRWAAAPSTITPSHANANLT